MSRKQGKTADDVKRPVNVKLSPSLHKLLRRLAAESETSMSEYATSILIKGMKAEAERSKIAVE